MRRLVIAVLILVGLLVAADYGAAALAESAVSRQMREQLGLVDDPSVRINGFPFLTQALTGQYSSIYVDASRISYGELRELAISAELKNVTAPLSMLLGSGPKSLPVRTAVGTVRISGGDLERLVPDLEKLRIESVDDDFLLKLTEDGADSSIRRLDPNRSVRLVGTYPVLSQETEVAVVAVLELADGKTQVVARDIRLADGTALPISAADQRDLLAEFTIPIDAGSLPLQVQPEKFRAVDGRLEISGVATDLVLGAATTR